MLITEQVELPDSVRVRLREQAAFSDSFHRFTRERLLGFGYPVAAAAGLLAPIVVAFAYASSDLATTVQVTSVFGFTAALFLLGGWILNREALGEAYEGLTEARRTARGALKAGVGQELSLRTPAPAHFYEHTYGVAVFADAGDGRTIFFDIEADTDDPRWFLYLNGDLHREQWSWIRLPGSGAVVSFLASGPRRTSHDPVLPPATLDAWDAVSLALGDPADGDIISMPFREVKATIARLL